MSQFLHDDVRDLGLQQISTNTNWSGAVLKLAVCMRAATAVADVTALYGANATAARVSDEISLAPADVPLGPKAGGGREIVIPAKAGTAQVSVTQADAGTASAGGANTLTDSSKAWTANAHAGWVVHIIAGTGAGQKLTILSNTATQLTVDANWTTQPDATSQYVIRPDIVAVVYDGARVLACMDDVVDGDIANGATVNIASLSIGFGA